MSVFTWAHTPLQSLAKTYLGVLVYPEMIAVISWIMVEASMLVLACF